MSNIRVVYIITLSELGGAQVHLYELILNLPDNIKPYIIVGQSGWLSEKLLSLGYRVYYANSLVRDISFLNDIKAICQIKNLIREIQPNFVHCHSSKAGFIGRIAAKLNGVSSIFTAHGWSFTEGVSPKKQYIYKILEKCIAKWTNKIICVSEYDRQIALNAMPEYENKLVAIHNAISDQSLDQSLDQSFRSNIIKLVMVARFNLQKNQDAVVESMDRLLKKGLEVHLTFIGNGPRLTLIKNLSSKLNLDKHIEFLGSRNDVDEILSKQDIFLLISNWEGLPISILEAMRQGLPIIASDVGGISELVVDNENGFLIPRNKLDLLEEKIEFLARNKKLREHMGMNSRKRYENQFSIQEMMKKTMKVYKEILKED